MSQIEILFTFHTVKSASMHLSFEAWGKHIKELENHADYVLRVDVELYGATNRLSS